MKVIKYLRPFFPNWLISAVLYGFSWGIFIDINLSFLAWFAFIPLFFALEKKKNFLNFLIQVFLFCIVAYTLLGHGFLTIPKKRLFALIVAAHELFLISIPFIFLYLLKKKFGYHKSLILFPFIIALWEWFYQILEHTFGYWLLANSQCQNKWLIQYIDIFGVWSISTWVMTFNILLFFLLKKFSGRYTQLVFYKKLALVVVIMILPPFLYSLVRYEQLKARTGRQFNVTLINTHFDLHLINFNENVFKMKRMASITDSINNEFKKHGYINDLYVWHEVAIDFGNDPFITNYLDSIVKNWNTPLLTGIQVIPTTAPKNDRRWVNRAVLINPDNLSDTIQYYDKLRMVPGKEKIPYHELLSKIPRFPIALTDPKYYKTGNKIRLIELPTKVGYKIKTGTPLCIEQNYSSIWSDMAVEGAECFMQLSFEAWWSSNYFLKQMSNITTLRCIETKKYAARCSNFGVTEFIDPFGRVYLRAKNKEGALNAGITAYNETTFFSRNQWFYPILCITIIFSLSIYFMIIKSSNNSLEAKKKKYLSPNFFK